MRPLLRGWRLKMCGSIFSVLARLVLVILSANVFIAASCGVPKAAPAIPSPKVEVASVLKKDVPIFSEWVVTLNCHSRRFSPRWRDTSSGKHKKKVRLCVRTEGHPNVRDQVWDVLAFGAWAGLLYFSCSPLGRVHI